MTGATSYRVQVSSSSAFGTLAFDQALAGTSTTVSPALAGKTTYFWRVNASNAAETSPWSAVGNFKTRRNN